MTDTKSKRPRNRDIRELTLTTALRLFTDQGYFNTSVHDIRRAADISTGSIYHHFGNKEAIASALFHSLLERMATLMEEIYAQHTTANERCRSVVERLFTLTDQEPEAMSFILNARHREFMPSERPICSSKPFEMMRQMVQEGIDSGAIRPMDTIVASACLFGGPIRMIHLRLDGVIETPLIDQLDTVWDCAWRAVAN